MSPESRADRAFPPTRSWALAAFYLAVCVIALAPIFLFAVPPLGDLPNHLARAYILANLASDHDLQARYTTEWRLLSFQSTDFILPPLVKLIGLSLGVRVYIAAAFLLLLAGSAAIHRSLFGRVGPWPAAAALFLYNFPLVQGQISYLFATGIGLLLFAAWIADPARGWLRLVAFTIAAFVLFLCHPYAFATYALMTFAFEWSALPEVHNWRQRMVRLVQAILPLIVPTACLLFSLAGSSAHQVTRYGDLLSKALVVLAATTTYGRWPDIVLTVTICAALWLLKRRHFLVFAHPMRRTAFILLLFAILMPKVVGGVFGADLRIPCLLAFLLIAASDLRPLGARHSSTFMIGILALLMFRVATITAQWRAFDADYREFRAADALIERGSRVVAIPPADETLRLHPQPLFPHTHVADFAVIDRDAFVPQLFTFATPLRFTAPGAALSSDQFANARTVHWRPTDPRFVSLDPRSLAQADAVGQAISDNDLVTSAIDWSDWPERFDYAVDLDFGQHTNPVPALLTEVARGSYFTLYRIHPPQR
jgi:hypothetical protein